MTPLGIRKQENYLETGKPELMTFSPGKWKKAVTLNIYV
jgi:hypothetical protein